MRGDGYDRGIAPVGVVQAVDEMDMSGAAGARAGREFFGKLGFGPGGEGGRFFMPHMDEPDAPVAAERIGHGIEAVAHPPVQPRDARSGQFVHKYFRYGSLRHGMPPEKGFGFRAEARPKC